MTGTVETIVAEYRAQSLNRRDFIARLSAVTGSYAAAHLLLESSGLAATLISQRESQAAKVTSTTIEYKSDQTPVSAYLSVPQETGKFPAVVVIHENRGLNDHTRDVARRFAAEGFVALAPDLLSRKGTTAKMPTPDAAREALMQIPPEDSIKDLQAALAHLNAHSSVKIGQLASTGFCWGGARSFTLATESDQLRAAVVFYGTAPAPEKLQQARCPVLGLYGEKDERITSRVPETVEAMKKFGKRFEHHIYPGADHAFFNDTGTRYNAETAKDAWNRTLAFLRTNLR